MAKPQEELWTEKHADGGYSKNIFSVTSSTVLQEALITRLQTLPEGSSVLLPGCGSSRTLPHAIAKSCPNISKVEGIDFPDVIYKSLERPTDEDMQQEWFKKIMFSGTDVLLYAQSYSNLNRFDAVVPVNSTVAPSLRENLDLFRAFYAVTKPGGKLIGMVPTIEFSMGLSDPQKLKTSPLKTAFFMLTSPLMINKEEETLHPPGGLKQNLPSRGSLKAMLDKVGYEGAEIERIVLSDDNAQAFQAKAYGPFNPAEPVWEYLVEAHRPEVIV